MGACGQRGASCSVALRARRVRKKIHLDAMAKKHHVIHCGASLSLSDGDAASRLRRRHARLPGPNGPPVVHERRVPLEANAFGVVRGSRGVPGTRSGAGKTNPKPETRPRRSPGFFHACGSGSARGGSREGRHAPRLCCTGAVTRVATAARAEREKAAADILDCARSENGRAGHGHGRKKRETWPGAFPLIFLRLLDQGPNFQRLVYVLVPMEWRQVFKCSPSEIFLGNGLDLETFAEPASLIPVARWRCLPRAAKREGWRRARGEPLRTSVRRRGRVSDAPRVTAPRPPRVSLGRLRASSAPRRRRR